MSRYWNKKFWIDAADRAIATFAQTTVATGLTGITGLLEIDVIQVVSVSGLASVISLLTSIAFRGRDDNSDPRENGLGGTAPTV